MTAETTRRERHWACVDGNHAAARVAHRLSEVLAIYPITPASPMGEYADAWSGQGRPNLWGVVPEVIEMQSEGGAAGALHGAVQKGSLATSFTASQGLLLMLPNLYKIAGELTPAVIHVAARAVATHALSIFGDHSDVMAARTTGWALLASGSVQEAQDLALVAHAATLRSRVPFLHFFDGFRTSHEVNKIELLDDADLAALIDLDDVLAHRERGLSPDRPVLRGSAQNPDVFFQAREAANPFYDALPGIVQQTMDALAERTGRAYRLVDYVGHPEAERVLVLMGSGAGAAREAVAALEAAGERVGLLIVRLYRPFPTEALIRALPATVRVLAVLDRTKEPGAAGEPLTLDVVTAAARAAEQGALARMPRVRGGRYGLASKEFTPAMARAVLAAAAEPAMPESFSVGIRDDVSGRSLAVDAGFVTEHAGDGRVRALFYGLGSDGSVGAAKSSVAIIGEHTPLHAQGYFVYDSKKSGAITVSHVRFGPEPIHSSYQIDAASFVGCHHLELLDRADVLARAAPGATLLLNAPGDPETVWERLSRESQEEILARQIDLWAVDADRVAAEVGLGRRINTVMQACFFALADVLPREEALRAIRAQIESSYGRLGPAVVARNVRAVERSIDAPVRVVVPRRASSARHRRPLVPKHAPDFVQRVTARLLAGQGDLLPVSALPVDGTFPTGTARFEKRGIARELPLWDPELCIDCGKCAMVCPHAAIRMKVYPPESRRGAPEGFLAKAFRTRDLPGHELTIQLAPDDCTGCGVCADVCPAHSKSEVKHKALVMQPGAGRFEAERRSFEFFLSIPELEAGALAPDTVKHAQTREPLFEFSGACAGCGETPYLKLLSQLFGDHIVVANATGCSSIYGGNLPTTPWGTNAAGRGPAWANSLFEDNAEFGLGLRLGLDRQRAEAGMLLAGLAADVGEPLAREILAAEAEDDASIQAQRARVAELRERLARLGSGRATEARRLASLAGALVRQSVWIVGGDGWAHDIGSAGLDHVLASGRDVNVLVLDTQVYSNTGGQASKATPRGAVAKFAATGKSAARKDLGMIASAYGNVYVAQVALGANDLHTLRAFREADAWRGPSLVIAYSTCIAHGIDMARSMSHQKDAVRSGFWPLWRYHPGLDPHEHPFHLDSPAPKIPLRRFAEQEGRFAMLERSDPQRADELMALAQADADERWRLYRQLAGVERTVPHTEEGPEP